MVETQFLPLLKQIEGDDVGKPRRDVRMGQVCAEPTEEGEEQPSTTNGGEAKTWEDGSWYFTDKETWWVVSRKGSLELTLADLRADPNDADPDNDRGETGDGGGEQYLRGARRRCIELFVSNEVTVPDGGGMDGIW